MALAVEDVCDGSIETSRLQRKPCLPTKGIRQRCRDLLSVKKGGVGQNLMQVGAVTLPDVICHTAPAAFVDFGEMRFVLGVDDSDRASPNDDHVWHEVAKRAVARVRPVQRRQGLAQPADAHCATSSTHIFSDLRFDVVLPQSIQTHRPGESIHLTTASETTFIAHPANGVQTTAKGLVQKRITAEESSEQLGPRINPRHVVHTREHEHGGTLEVHRDSILATDNDQLLQYPLERPSHGASQQRVTRQIGKARRNLMPSTGR